MILQIKNTARDLKIRLPDLITRPVGRRMYERTRKSMAHVGDGEVVLVDFSGVQVIDSSFIDEFLLRLIEDSREESPVFFVKLANITPIIETNIDSVFSSYQAYNERRIAVVTESLTAMNSYCIGIISGHERDVLDYLRINRVAALGDIAAFVGMREEDALPLVEGLYGLRVVRREHSGPPGRYEAV
jgi:anti-anti-sigma regulatory factor